MPVSKEKKKIPEISILTKDVAHPVWLSVSEAAKICGVNTKTIRRAIQAKTIKYKIVKDRYLLDLTSVIIYVYKYKKLINKLNTYGLGQYIDKWRE